MLSDPAVLILFDEQCQEMYVSSGASKYGIGAVLTQVKNGQEKPISFASRLLSPAERKYSAGGKEALAAIWSKEKWHYFLYGRKFTHRTDHSALEALLTRGTKGIVPQRIQRWYKRFLVYDFQVTHRPGKNNQVADCLSRLLIKDDDSAIPYEKMEQELVEYVFSMEEHTSLG